MQVEKCKWKYGKQAPVMFMIDDFANKYMTDKMDGNYVGSDWGGKCKEEYSLYQFFQERLFRDFPYLKMTLFLVVGRREGLIANGKPSVSRRIDENPEFGDFLREISEDDHFEVAFHGYTHGKLLDKYLTQEWRTFASLEEACQTIDMCKGIYRKVTGKEFYGGKYCGYEYNDFSDESIAKSGFEWWCRHWDGSIFTNRGTGAENIEIEEFQGVVDIPSTVDGGLASLRDLHAFPGRAWQKAVYYRLKYGVTMEQVLRKLIKNGQVINIQEHSSPMREDDKHQSPNLVDDIGNIRYMLRYLKKYDLWYATGHEIAEYWKTYQYTELTAEGDKVVLQTTRSALAGKTLWLAVRDEGGGVPMLRCGDVILSGVKSGGQYLFEVELQEGRQILYACR